ncbi:Uncharacterized membrane-anchored protein [Myxococcus fulvus]|uniref:Uncharacterized membrane-anchored protein n=1 Tax=Myxococcus fulvus TaxID=33 RepID=A0A511SU45_MYXFU|nr:DUF2167 domain-containing protein [Myxococcus fulvus]GEN05446.1 hypothetical protein MFU01_04830 [Myxococcus fulvus]SET06819.1 Uncharacterized membrane-anchored protein [Myxococcus fulvus]
MQCRRGLFAVVLLVGVSAWAQAPEQQEVAEEAEVVAPAMPELHLRTGVVVLGNGLAKMNVPSNFGYLSPEDAEKVLVEVWGNPPGTKTLGMLVPSDVSVDAPEGWGVVIQYDDDGHVEDKDAASIDYAELLEEMQEGTREENKERTRAGFEAVDLVGWAATPHYDASTRKLYWAQELAFGGSKEHTLNYAVRVLGKEGVLVLNAVSSMVALHQVEKDMKQVLAFTEFQEGHRYEDFDPSTGRVAAYGVAGLVAGKVAAKAGLFKGLLAVLLAGKKVVIAGVVMLFVALGKLFKRGGNSDGTP